MKNVYFNKYSKLNLECNNILIHINKLKNMKTSLCGQVSSENTQQSIVFAL